MNVVPKDFTIHGLLSSPNEQFTIPSYQRRYAWKQNQVAALFKDIDMLLPNDGHLFGMLILHSSYHQGGINCIDVVDGQQRLTTISILLYALMEKFEEIGDTYSANQTKQLLYCGDPENSNDLKLVLGELDHPDYKRLLSKDLEDIENARILEAYEFSLESIKEGMEEGGKSWIKTYLNKLILTAKIIRLDVQQAQDAYKLFETINNRGLKLSATDILKNFILGHAAKIDNDTLLKVKELWGQLIITLDGIPTDDFFRQYVSSIYTRKISKAKLVQEFKKDYFKRVKDVDRLGEYRYTYGAEEVDESQDEEDEIIEEPSKEQEEIENNATDERVPVTVYVSEILNAARCYAKIWYRRFDSEKINLAIKELNFIRSFPSYIYLMHYLQQDRDIKEQLSILRMIAILMLRRHVTGRSTAYNDDIFANLLRIELNEDGYRELVRDKLITDYPGDEEFETRFQTHELKQRVIDRARYMLTEIEYYLYKSTGEFSINSAKDVHVEHIIPQTISTKTSKEEFGDWEEYLGENANVLHKQKVNRIGNMTLLAGNLNISAYNNPFAKKKKSYRESNICITNELAKMSNFKFHHLDKRGEELAKHAVKIWKL